MDANEPETPPVSFGAPDSGRGSPAGLWPWAALLGLLALGLAAYAPSFGHGFVFFDDPVYVYENEVVSQGLTVPGAVWAFGFHASNWHPLTWLSHMLDVELFGLEPGGHHVVSFLLHALNATLFFLALRTMTGAVWTSLLAAGLFLLHPLRVESVAWISERKDVLSTSFWMLTLHAYAHHVKRPSRARLGLVALPLAVGLLAKQMLVTLPFVLLLLDGWPLRRWSFFGVNGASTARVWREKLVLFALAAAASVTIFLAQNRSGAVAELDPLPLVSRAANAIRSYAVYLLQTLWPKDLACFYPHPASPGMNTVQTLWIPAALAALFLGSLSFYAWKVRRLVPCLLVGWLWYLGTAVPVIGIVQVGQQAHADRYTYVPSLGLALAAAFGLRTLVHSRPGLRRGAIALSCALLLSLTLLTRAQVRTWKTSRTLFAHAVEATDENFHARTFHGVTLRNEGEFELARAEVEIAIRLHPGFPRSHWELGLIERANENWEASVRAMKNAVKLDPDDPRKRSDLASVLLPLGQLDEAERHLKRGLKHAPDHPDSLVNLGGVAFTRGDHRRAEELYRRVLELEPGHPKATLELAAVLLVTKREDEARPLVEYLRIQAPETAGLERLVRLLGE